jgi:hypothetical protein
MNLRRVLPILVITLMILAWANTAQAGFGISPPYVRNDKLTQGSHYEQKITLVRGDPVEDLKAEISVDIPGAGDWISIDKGMEFILPKGEKQVPMIVNVDVPKRAEYKNYKGFIRVVTSSFEPLEEGKVTIALGARIDVDLTVAEIKIFDFDVLSINTPSDLEEGWKFWKIKLPGEVKVLMKITNTGNIEAAPTRVHLDVYDISCKDLLESSDSISLEKIKSFETKEIFARFKTELETGAYCGEIKIFKEDEAVKEQKVFFNIVARGTLPSGAKEFLGLSIWIWIVIGVVVLAGVGSGGYRGYKFWRKTTTRPRTGAPASREALASRPRPPKRSSGPKKQK